MKKHTNVSLLETTCKQLEGLDIYQNPAARTLFYKAVIEYTRHELRRKGIDLLTLGTYDDLCGHCQLCLKNHPNLDTEMAVILVSHSIQSIANNISKIA